MEYKEADIVICCNDEPYNTFAKPYPSKLLLYKVENSKQNQDLFDINTKGISGANYTKWRVYKKDFRLANKEDLKEYLQFIFTNDKIWIKFDNTSDGNLISKIINKKYPYDKLILPEYIEKHDRFYFNRKLIFQNINEEHHLKAGYHIIEFKDIRHIINKINGK